MDLELEQIRSWDRFRVETDSELRYLELEQIQSQLIVSHSQLIRSATAATRIDQLNRPAKMSLGFLKARFWTQASGPCSGTAINERPHPTGLVLSPGLISPKSHTPARWSWRPFSAY
jgi:hypothetical protein